MAAQPNLLSGELTSFVGRRQEVADLRRLLSTSRLVTLTGIGGVGKTRLALKLASDARRAFPDGIGVVELAALEDPALLATYVMQTLGILEQASREPADVVCEQLSGQRMLLVIDNCEHVIARVGDLVDRILRTAPGIRVLATSTRPLKLSAEHVFVVPPLSAPAVDESFEPGTATQYPAVALFADRSVAVVPDFALTPSNEAAIVRLCQRLEGIPLAIELAAVRLKVLSIDGLVERLDDRFHLLREGSRDLPERHRTLQAVIDWSYELCTPQEQALWARASVFSGGFTVDALEAVCADAGLPADQMLDTVGGLLDKSIIGRDQVGSQVRFEMLETIRSYGLAQLETGGEANRQRRRHRDWCVGLLESAGGAWAGDQQQDWATTLFAERPNLRTALEWCMTQPGEARTALYMTAVPWFWISMGHLAEGRYWLRRALALDDAPGIERSWALSTDAYLAVLQGDLATVPAMIEMARAAAPDDLASQAFAQHVLGVHRNLDGDVAGAIALLTEALDQYVACGVPPQYPDLLRIELGVAYIFAEELELGAAIFDELLERAEAAGERWQLSYALWGRGLIALIRGEFEQAEADASDAILIKRHFQDALGLAVTIDLLAWATVARGEARRGVMLLGGTNALWRAIGGTPLFGWDFMVDLRDQFEAAARKAIGDSEFKTTLDRGTALTVDETIALALRESAQPPAASAPRTTSTLTRREREVAVLVGEGLSNKDIAGKLVISVRTVEAHVEHILTKLGFSARTQVASWIAQQQ